MKKNIARIQRWLDRMSSACEGHKWDSALIEADCLSAEIRKTREEILDSARGERKEKAWPDGRRRLFMALRTASVSFAIILAASLPSALEADKPQISAAETVYVKEDRLSWVTPEEEILLLTLRSEMSKGDLITAGAAANTQARKNGGAATENARNSSESEAQPGGGQERARKETVAANSVTPDDLAALVQIGEKALRGNSPAVKIIN